MPAFKNSTFRIDSFCSHTCDHLIVLCSDFRFGKANLKFLKEEGIDVYDEIRIPGGIKSLVDSIGSFIDEESFVFNWIKFFHFKHKVRLVHLVSHANCGKYIADGIVFDDDEAEELFHRRQLFVAGGFLEQSFPKIRTFLHYAKMSKNRKKVEYVKVE